MILQQVKNELANGCVKKRHPFRYFTLGTLKNDRPRQRMVVLRKIRSDFGLLFYTDSRSCKVGELKKNPNVSALFYHPKKMMQLQITGEAFFEQDKDTLKKVWCSIPIHARRDYTTTMPPGYELGDLDNLEYHVDQNFFCMIIIRPLQIDYLKLDKPYHQRVRFQKSDDGWSHTQLVP